MKRLRKTVLFLLVAMLPAMCLCACSSETPSATQSGTATGETLAFAIVQPMSHTSWIRYGTPLFPN